MSSQQHGPGTLPELLHRIGHGDRDALTPQQISAVNMAVRELLKGPIAINPWTGRAALSPTARNPGPCGRGRRHDPAPDSLSRRKGFRLADQAPGETVVIVARPHKWGNPYPVKEHGRDEAIRLYREWLPTSGLDPRELAGCHLACWCPLDQACHADVLLEIANWSGKS